ncbi:hypothetical protein SAMN04487820_10156 [Actinopolyspora mzabensis]|uniref:Anti-sigma-D factor RsdA to sigma factor binding region n=1 Tax=Actinopolyspora mzabensis TaxID=995066 RepID=A0A1G8VG61_ACTMZ|nr:hypothetical protein [Actinopolyspora mzabensis]SDJ64884.1 hypothetical protein SAMN04487820_10156 [Actinopolyspora mzabensis]
MAERRGSGSDDDGRDSVEPDRQDDRFSAQEETGPGSDSSGDDSGTSVESRSEEQSSGDHDVGVTGEPGHSGEGGATAAEIVDFPSGGRRFGSESDEVTVPDDTLLSDEMLLSEEERASEEDLALADELTRTDGEVDEEPVDLARLRADDELLDMLGQSGGHSDSAGAGTDVEDLLVAWRRDVDATPMGELVGVERAAAAVEEGRPKRRSRVPRLRHLVPVASAAAVLMIGFTGVGLAARDAAPGDALWGVTQVLYSDRAASAAAASRAQSQLDVASQAWQNGREEAAETALHRAEEQFDTIDPGERRSDLRAAHASLRAKFDRPAETPGISSTEESGSEDPGSSAPDESGSEKPGDSVSESPGNSGESNPPSSGTTPSPTDGSEPSETSDQERPPSPSETDPSETGASSSEDETAPGSGSGQARSSQSD